MSVAAAAPRARAGAVALVIGGLVGQEAGASIAVFLFPIAGALGAVTLRLVFSAIILVLIARPRLTGYGRVAWTTVVGFGLVLAAMNVLFYQALDRLPLGTTVTIEVLGPLIVSVATSRRASSWLWAVLAFVGVAFLGGGGFDRLDPLGVLYAAGAGAAWAGYILLSARTGAAFARLDGLAIAITIGAVVTLPFGILATGAVLLDPLVLLMGAAVAVLSSTIPYAFELLALRRLPSSTFAVLMSLAPATAALAGFVVLGQRMSLAASIGIGLVVIASAGAVRTATRSLPPIGPGAP